MKPFNVSGQLEKNIKATSLYLVALEGKMSLLTHVISICRYSVCGRVCSSVQKASSKWVRPNFTAL